MARHPFYSVPPRELDCGQLIDSETEDDLRPATADEAIRSLRAQKREGDFHGVIGTTYCGEPVLAFVRAPEGVTLPDWRLAVALKLRYDRLEERAF
jgi:hypothetical protein